MSRIGFMLIPLVSLLLTACASTTQRPLECDWKIPSHKLQSCPQSLPQLPVKANLGDLLVAATEASAVYHACRLDHDDLIAVVKLREEICNAK